MFHNKKTLMIKKNKKILGQFGLHYAWGQFVPFAVFMPWAVSCLELYCALGCFELGPFRDGLFCMCIVINSVSCLLLYIVLIMCPTHLSPLITVEFDMSNL